MIDSLRKCPHVLPGLLAMAALVALAGCKQRSAGPQGPPQMPPTLVTTTEVIAQDVPVYMDEIGKCTAFQTVSIKPQVTGTIDKISFVDGKDVVKDQVLFEIDPRPYQAALAQARAQLAQATAQRDFAKVDFNRIKDLPRTVEPQSDVDAKQNAIDIAKAQVAAAEAAIQAADVNLKYCTIKSPLDGLAGQRLVDAGNVVIANNPMGASAALLMVQQMDPVYADFTVTENDLAKVRKNMTEGTLKTFVRLSGDKEAREGALSFLDNAVQDGAGTVKLRATIPNKDRHFWPGQFVFAKLVLKVQKDALLVPTSAVQVGQQGAYVYVINENSTAELRVVQPGQPQGELTVIESGLSAGEKVVVTGQMMVFPGGKVRELPPMPAEAGKEEKPGISNLKSEIRNPAATSQVSNPKSEGEKPAATSQVSNPKSDIPAPRSGGRD